MNTAQHTVAAITAEALHQRLLEKGPKPIERVIYLHTFYGGKRREALAAIDLLIADGRMLPSIIDFTPHVEAVKP